MTQDYVGEDLAGLVAKECGTDSEGSTGHSRGMSNKRSPLVDETSVEGTDVEAIHVRHPDTARPLLRASIYHLILSASLT